MQHNRYTMQKVLVFAAEIARLSDYISEKNRPAHIADSELQKAQGTSASLHTRSAA
jgi:hypothetical protein